MTQVVQWTCTPHTGSHGQADSSPCSRQDGGARSQAVPKQGERDFGVSARWLADGTDAWPVVRAALLRSIRSQLCVGVGVGVGRDTKGLSCLLLREGPLGLSCELALRRPRRRRKGRPAGASCSRLSSVKQLDGTKELQGVLGGAWGSRTGAQNTPA